MEKEGRHTLVSVLVCYVVHMIWCGIGNKCKTQPSGLRMQQQEQHISAESEKEL